MHLYLVRHAESVCNVHDIFPGRSPNTNLSLTDRGHTQAIATAQRFKQLHKQLIVYYSPARRTKETTEHITKATDAESIVEHGFWDRDLGKIVGLTRRDVKERYPEWYEGRDRTEFSLDDAPPGGETRRGYFLRVSKAWRAIPLTYNKQSPSIVIVTHDSTIAILCHLILEIPYTGIFQFWPVHNCSVTKFEFNRPGYKNKACMVYLNDISHLNTRDSRR